MFEMILFLDPVRVNPFLVEDGQKSNDVVIIFAWSEIKRCKLWTSCQKIHHPSINRFGGVYRLFLGSDY